MKQLRPHILVAVALTIAHFSGLPARLQDALTDFRFGWTQRDATGDLVIVAIDAPSIQEIGVWPWSRKLHADLLGKLEKAGAREVAFDVDFSSASDPDADQAFATALRDAGGSTILPSFQQPKSNDRKGEILVNRPIKAFEENSWSALVNVDVESDGLVRRYSLGGIIGGQELPSMGAILAGRSPTGTQQFLIDFGIRSQTIPRISFNDVLREETSAFSLLKDKKVIIGATAIELGDRLSVPGGRVVSGPLLQSLATESILQNRLLRQTTDLATLLGTGLIAGLMLFTWRRLIASKRVLLLAGFAVAVEAMAIFAQGKYPIVLDTALIDVAILAYLLVIGLDELDFRTLLGSIAERRFHRVAMSIGDGLACTDGDQKITLWNPNAAAMFGYGSADAIGERLDVLCDLTHSGSPFSLNKFDIERYQSPGGEIVELLARKKDGTVFPIEACLSGWSGTDGFHYGVVMRDISVRKREAERIRYLAEFDVLTELPNRHSLIRHLEAETDVPVALILIGHDNFQRINDVWGHACGDAFLTAVAQRLKADLPKYFVARVSGEEFAVALSGADLKAVSRACSQIREIFEKPFSAGTRCLSIEMKMGSATLPDDAASPEKLLSNGRLALREAKVLGVSHIVFNNRLREKLVSRLNLEEELFSAFAKNEFTLFYQPQMHLSQNKLVGAEALIRWQHPTRGLISPADFMSVVNASSISNDVATWVLNTACDQARAWETAGHPLRMGVNLSPSLLASNNLPDLVRQTLARTGLTPSLLELEVTEDILINDEERVLRIFLEIQKLGVRIVFDDFGTGYGSLSYLKRFPLNGLKIDRSFVSGLTKSSHDAAIVAATIELSKKLGLSIIAEGIERPETADLLIQMGCAEGQGYHFGRPICSSDFEANYLGIVHPLLEVVESPPVTPDDPREFQAAE